MPTTSSVVLAVPKLVGICSLGLLTGSSACLASLALPSLLTLPSATHAHRTYKALIANAVLFTRTLSTISITALTAAYILSPHRARHPYLIWSSLLAAGAIGVDYISSSKGGAAGSLSIRQGEDGGNGINGEVVEKAVRGRMMAETQRAVVAGLGFVLGVVGIWGDGA